jgi:hypothetical protein
VVDDFAALCTLFRVSKVIGDHYGGEFVKEPFRRYGVRFELCKSPKSDLYRDLLPLLNSGSITLPRSDRLISQIVGLERRVTRAGKDSIDHAPSGHDDIINAVAGCAIALRKPGYDLEAMVYGEAGRPNADPDGFQAHRMAQFWSHIGGR